MWPAVIAVVGTLAGGLLAWWGQARQARAARREAREDAQRADTLAAVTALSEALANHRRAMWMSEYQHLSGAAEHVVAEVVATTHETRAAITAPLTQVTILAPDVAGPARDAAQATYAMRCAPTLDRLEELRATALAACNRFTDAAADFFAVRATPGRVAR